LYEDDKRLADDILHKALIAQDTICRFSPHLTWLFCKVSMLHAMQDCSIESDLQHNIAELKKIIPYMNEVDAMVAELEVAILKESLTYLDNQEKEGLLIRCLDKLPFINGLVATLDIASRLMLLDQVVGKQALALIEQLSVQCGRIPARIFPKYEALASDGDIELSNLRNHLDYDWFNGNKESVREDRVRLKTILECAVSEKHAVWFETNKRKILDRVPLDEYLGLKKLFYRLFSDAPFSEEEKVLRYINTPCENKQEGFSLVKALPLGYATAYFVPVIFAIVSPNDRQKLYENFPTMPDSKS